MGTIFLKDVLAEMMLDKEFSMTFVTYDGKRKRMGDIIEVEKAKCTWGKKSESGSESGAGSEGRRKNGKNNADGTDVVVVRKNRQPNHFENATRNIVIGSQLRKVHIRLITHFNGKNVIW